MSGKLVVMGMRRRARERAIQFLYQNDLNPALNLDEALAHFYESQKQAVIRDEGAHVFPAADRVPSTPAPTAAPAPGAPASSPEAKAADAAALLNEEITAQRFADPLIRGVLQHLDVLDVELQKYVHNWDVRRMAAVDRNVLRLALFEMRHRDDIPPVVSINEAVEIAKRFSTQESGKFVNGILDRIKGDLMRNARVGTITP